MQLETLSKHSNKPFRLHYFRRISMKTTFAHKQCADAVFLYSYESRLTRHNPFYSLYGRQLSLFNLNGTTYSNFPKNSFNRAFVATYMAPSYGLARVLFVTLYVFGQQTNKNYDECFHRMRMREKVSSFQLFTVLFYIDKCTKCAIRAKNVKLETIFVSFWYASGCSLDVNACHKWDVCRLEFRIFALKFLTNPTLTSSFVWHLRKCIRNANS